jgi:hypothetical protein
MNEMFTIVVDEADPGTVAMTGRMAGTCQAELADALARAACHGRCRLDLTGVDALHVAALEVLSVLAREVDLELMIRSGGPIAHAVHAAGLDQAATVHEVFTIAVPDQPAARMAVSS